MWILTVRDCVLTSYSPSQFHRNHNMSVRPVPEGHHSVTPYLVVDDAARLMAFLRDAFQAVEVHRMTGPDGRVRHAQVKLGDSMVMMGEPQGQGKPLPCALYLYVENADAVYQRALKAGATSIMEPADQFYGDRHGGVTDPFGNQWWIATHIEDVSNEEIARRAANLHKA